MAEDNEISSVSAPVTDVAAPVVVPAPVIDAPVAVLEAKPAKVRKVVAKAPKVEPSVAPKKISKRSVAVPTPVVAEAAVKPAGKPARKVKAAPTITARTKTAKINTAPISTPKAAPRPRALPQTKDTKMATKSFDITATIKTALSDLQGKAKTAYEKGTEAVTEANGFAKGNVEAVVESSKILATGLQELGTTMVAESRTAFETLTAEVKELAAAKSPTDFFQLQSALLRKQFDSAVAHTSKNTEAMLKLANDTFSPLSNRVTLAVEKASKVA